MLTASLSACSALYVDGPQPLPSGEVKVEECSRSRFWPIIDVALASTFGAVALGASVTDTSEQGQSNRIVIVATYGALAGLFTAVGLHGFHKVSRCREAQAKAAARAIDPFAR
jgi:hypothetical protein